MKIGVTFGTRDHSETAHNTGILQNSVNLVTCLNHIHETWLVQTCFPMDNNKKYEFNIYDYPVVGIDEIFRDEKLFGFDMMIILGGELVDSDLESLQNRGVKVVYYNCGAMYQLHVMDVIFGKTKDEKYWRTRYQNYDGVWCIPQNWKRNEYYQRVLFRQDEIPDVPFLYDPTFIDKGLHALDSNFQKAVYKPNRSVGKRLSIMESNRDWLKNYVQPLLISESVYRKKPELISQISINNFDGFKDVNLDTLLETMDVWMSNNTISYVNGWFPVYEYLETYTDIVVSHQRDNELSYYPLDILYLEYPLVHNYGLIREAGYYYEDWNFDQAEEKLEEALRFHDTNLDIYNHRAKKVLDRYSPFNGDNIDKYSKLIKQYIGE